jgi:tetratricopeptide (TPR) repeat protein
MRWLTTESLLKGVFLGLMCYAALLQAEDAKWETLAWANLPILGGLALALIVAAVAKLREGFRPRGRPLVFVLFLLLESPWLVYAGVLAGAAVGIYLVHQLIHTNGPMDVFVPCVIGGAAVGVGFSFVRRIPARLRRMVWGFLLAAGVAGGVLFWLGLLGKFEGVQNYDLEHKNTLIFAVQALLALPLFYLLTFAGRDDETEAEFGGLCAGLAVGLTALTASKLFGQDSPALEEHERYILFIVPAVLYLIYAFRWLPRLRVYKHAFRGLTYAKVGQHRQALQAYRRALQLDPKNALARGGFWDVHRALDLTRLADDPQTLALVDLDLCMDRAGALLVQGTPTADQIRESMQLLVLVLRLRPALQPQADYWRAVAHTHARRLDEAAADLERIIDPAHYGHDNPQRQAVLFPAWQLAYVLHDELRRRVGAPQLALPGRRLEAIAAVERHLKENPKDQGAFALKQTLYADLSEKEYFETLGESPPAPDAPRAFDYQYVQQLGLALVDDDARWQRGGEYLRMAAHGLPALGPTLFLQIANAHQRAGHGEQARHYFELAKRAGRSIGPKNLAEAERQAYFAVVKHLGDEAAASNDLDAAVENYHLFAESERSGVETLRTLADLYERKQDALAAARLTEQALLYGPRDPDLLARKDRYYFSIMPEALGERLEQARGFLDFDYCVRRTKTILDGNFADAEWLEVAAHLSRLAMALKPENLRARVLQARVLLRSGERDQAAALLEQVRSPKPASFGAEEEEAWYQACQFLGDLYLEAGQTELAVECLSEFRNSAKSGARTLYKLGQAYEQLGDRPKAVRCYQLVTAYDGNPLVYDARSAISRLQTS